MDSESGDSFETDFGPTDTPLDVGNKAVAGREMEDVKFTVTNQPTEAAKVEEEGAKKGRRRPGTSNAVRTRAKIVDVLHLRPPHKVKPRVARNVPEEERTPEYYEYRRKNTEAARRCREKKRMVDQQRVEIIMRQQAKIEELENRRASLEYENQIYQGIIRKLAKQRRQGSQQVSQLSPEEAFKGRGQGRK